eukprot:TRINITY_DN9816_c0_g1_i5.p1 TRINITY_DN9816_c0_g1~~TRINITY_DN9816_c0_g1_i5.p1  ORF type:complete len:1324 (+),score=127.65 TRINITY_DN9816_c0_g1_i5:119-4090(+)
MMWDKSTLILFIFVSLHGILSQAWNQIQTLTATNKNSGNLFGISVSMNDQFALVGASSVDFGAMWQAGAAYMFTRSENRWLDGMMLTASNKNADDYFGISVAISNNYALVGAYNADPGSVPDSGAVYIFSYSNLRWSEDAILTASNKRAMDRFGISLSLTDNYALVGAPNADLGGISNVGLAYVFVRVATTWQQQAILSSSLRPRGDNFGYAVSITDKYLLVGAPYASVDSTSSSGVAYLFSRSADKWIQQIVLTGSNKRDSDKFGTALALTDNFAAIGLDSFASRSYVFKNHGGVWAEHQIIEQYSSDRCIAITENLLMIRNSIYTRSGDSWVFQSSFSQTYVMSVSLTEKYSIIGNGYAYNGALSGAGESYIFLNPVTSTLMNLYEATGGSSWINKQGWGTSDPYCKWNGIVCDPECSFEDVENDRCAIVELRLAKNNMKGQMPSPFLDQLKHLDLSYNSLTGSIPNFNLPNLVSLNLSENQFSGNLPRLNLPLLVALDLGGNNITGSIPELTMPRLQLFRLCRNAFLGSLPEFIMPRLIEMDLCCNRFTGSIPLFTMPRMVSFNLAKNELSGPMSILTMPNLRFFNISWNKLTGSIPIFNMPELVYFDLDENNISGTLPNFDSNYLKWVSIKMNNLTGAVPVLPTSIEFLDLEGNPELIYPRRVLERFYQGLEGELWVNKSMWMSQNSICLWNGVECDLGCSPIQGKKSLCPVVSLLLRKNNLRGRLSTALWMDGLSSLENLDLSGNMISGTIPVLSLSKLVSVRLDDNYLTGSVPELSLSNLVYLHLRNNMLDGINQRIDLGSLTLLDVSGNRLTGMLPPFVKLPSLVRLDLSSNELTSMPSLLLPNLQTLLIFNNSISGVLPDLVLPQLTYLDMSNNKLSEPLPDWRQLSNLEHFILSSNIILTGQLPSGMDNYSKISTVNIKDTKMKITTARLYPQTLKPNGQYQLLSTLDNYQCPVLSNEQVQQSLINIDPGYYEFYNCLCQPNTFGMRNQCVECPSSCDCPDGLTLKGCFPSPSLQNMSYILRCSNPTSCKTLLPQEIVFSKDASQDNVQSCIKGYEGMICSKCEAGYGSQGRSCVECSSTLTRVSFFMGPIIILAFVVYLYKSNGSSSGKLGILIFHVQTLSVVANALSDSPDVERSISIPLSISSIQIPNLPCIIGATDALTPIFVSFLRIPVVAVISCLALKLTSGQKKDKVIFVCFNLARCIYYPITLEVFGVFSCTVYDDGEQRWFLNAWPWISCDPYSEEYKILLALSIPTFFLFVCGYPLFVWWVINKYSHHNDTSRTEEERMSSRHRYGFLYLPYRKVRFSPSIFHN